MPNVMPGNGTGMCDKNYIHMRHTTVETTTIKKETVVGKKVLIAAALSLVVSTLLVLAPWIIRFSGSTFSTDPSNWGVFGDYFGGVLSTVISALGFIGIILTINIQARTISTQLSGITQEKEIRDDEVYSKQSLECLNEAFDKLKSPESGKLYKNRIAWLESARLIVTAQKLAERIKSDSMQHTYKAAEKVIRSKFSSLLNPDNSPETIQPSYFYEMEWDRWVKNQKQQPIYNISAYVIYQFASWQNDEPDELDSIIDSIDFHNISKRYLGARHFIKHGNVENSVMPNPPS
ncbi:hypothetical protein PCAU_2771 [Pseudomonas chlororaphis subsp. aurantiaca]|uniref:hypothetical protein n=1 Tax=Pseudomonas chlororaphis TaxID=587753 RepID=UPI000866249A|nr:hypothetical protein [Pseudomonas chlororaphis]BAV74980.1 hypothetical protein PCAU_2771 [Pseudomonas chlororaphis subsp. aurantiaca]